VIPDEVDIIALEVATFARQFDVVFTSGAWGRRTTMLPSRDCQGFLGIASFVILNSNTFCVAAMAAI
jgi:hypothetical protein